MKKGFWAVPIALILLTGAVIAWMNSRDIDPETMVKATDPTALGALTPAEAATVADSAGADETEIVLADGSDLVLYLSTGSDFTPGVTAYNRVFETRDLGNGWTYVLEYTCGLTFETQYKNLLTEALGELQSVSFYLKDKDKCISPAEKSKSAYVVQAEVLLTDGTWETAFLDPKTKQFIGTAQQYGS